MGGLVAADALLAISNSRPDKEAPLWPRIIACIAFDTPVRMLPFIYMLSRLICYHSISDYTHPYSKTAPPKRLNTLTRRAR
jgi:hypothetical protein